MDLNGLKSPKETSAGFTKHRKPKIFVSSIDFGGRSGGAIVLGKLSAPGRPSYLDNRRQWPFALACAGGGCLDIFSSAVFEENVEVLS